MNQTGKMSSEFSGSSHEYARLFSLVFMLAHCDYGDIVEKMCWLNLGIWTNPQSGAQRIGANRDFQPNTFDHLSL